MFSCDFVIMGCYIVFDMCDFELDIEFECRINILEYLICKVKFLESWK